MTRQTRKFNGKIFHLVKTYQHKARAQRDARRIKKETGRLTRIVANKNRIYFLYSRKGKK